MSPSTKVVGHHAPATTATTQQQQQQQDQHHQQQEQQQDHHHQQHQQPALALPSLAPIALLIAVLGVGPVAEQAHPEPEVAAAPVPGHHDQPWPAVATAVGSLVSAFFAGVTAVRGAPAGQNLQGPERSSADLLLQAAEMRDLNRMGTLVARVAGGGDPATVRTALGDARDLVRMARDSLQASVRTTAQVGSSQVSIDAGNRAIAAAEAVVEQLGTVYDEFTAILAAAPPVAGPPGAAE